MQVADQTVFDNIDKTGGARTAYPSIAPDFTPGVKWGLYFSIFRFMCMVYVL